MVNSLFFAVLIVLILGVLYVMKGGNAPETGYTQTPKQYIEAVEQKKAARQAAQQMQQTLQQSTDRSDQVLDSINGQR